MVKARIYRPAKTAMQSGRARTRKWVLDFEPDQAKVTDPLIGWIGSADMNGQVRITFDSREDAIAFAERNALDYEVSAAHERHLVLKNYADKFAFDRVR
ncbi:ETC complex I subunit [Varunaivibrio sulfuroxidans]|nr:ETC complex I subunit [Varunaivibrio sulfuroxidans]